MPGAWAANGAVQGHLTTTKSCSYVWQWRCPPPPWNPVDNYVLFNDVNIANNRRAVGSMDRDIEAVAEMGCADVRTATLHAIVTSWERGRVDHHGPLQMCKLLFAYNDGENVTTVQAKVTAPRTASRPSCWAP